MTLEHILLLIGIIILGLSAIIDHYHMRNMGDKYGKESREYKAYIKGASMGAFKIFILMALLFILNMNNMAVLSHEFHKQNIIENNTITDTIPSNNINRIDSVSIINYNISDK